MLVFTISNFCFAQQTVGLFYNSANAYNGYTLFIGGGDNMYLIDNCGELINHWVGEQRCGSTAYINKQGHLVRPIQKGVTNFNGGGIGGGVEKMDWEGNVIWRYDYAESYSHHQHHDIEELPNGNILILAWAYISAEEAQANGRATTSDVWPTQIVEVEPVGFDQANIVWTWNAWDHIIQNVNEQLPNYGVLSENPQLLDVNMGSLIPDWLHCNSIEYIPEFDQILISAKHSEEIYVIDHSTTTAEAASHEGGTYGKGGDILYRWGNPQNYDMGNDSDKRLDGQHDASWLASDLQIGAGQFMVFNNGFGGRLDAWTPPMNKDGSYNYTPGSAFEPADPGWSHDSEAIGFIGCSSRRLPYGNTLYCDSQSGKIIEVSIVQQKVWEYQIPVNQVGPVTQGVDLNILGNLGSFRAEKYAPDYEGFICKDLTPQGPIELEPFPSNCMLFDNPPDNFNPVMATQSIELQDIEIYPVPANDFIYVNHMLKKMTIYQLFNLNGKIITRGDFSNKINVTNLESGVYILKLLNDAEDVFTTHKILKR